MSVRILTSEDGDRDITGIYSYRLYPIWEMLYMVLNWGFL
jgi:hypothetical protein